MKYLSKLAILLVALSIISLQACNNDGFESGDAAKHVPAESSMVVSFNLEKLMDKANFEAVKSMEFYQKMIEEVRKEQGDEFAKIFEAPEKSGIDLTKNAYLFFEPSTEKERAIGGIIVSIADNDKFESLTKQAKGKVEQFGDIKFIASGGEAQLAWNGSVAFLGILEGFSNKGALEQKLTDLFSGKNSIASNSVATKSLASDHDISYYFTTTQIVEGMKDNLDMIGPFIKIEDLKNNQITGFTDFEAGKIVSKAEHDLQKGLVNELKMILGDGSSTDFSAYIPKENLGMLMTGQLNFKGINQLLKDKNLNGLANMQLNQAGLNTDDLAAAFDGDMVVALNSPTASDNPSYLFGIKIGKREKLNEFLDFFTKMGVFEKVSKDEYKMGYTGLPNDANGSLIIKGDLLFASNNLDLINKIKTGGLSKTERVSKETYKKAGNGVIGLMMDYANFNNSLSNAAPYGSSIEKMTSSFDWYKSESIIQMNDNSKNSLQLILEGINESYLKNKDKRNEATEEAPSYEINM